MTHYAYSSRSLIQSITSSAPPLSHVIMITSLCITAMISTGVTSSAHAFHRDEVEVNIINADHDHLPTYHHRGGLYVLGRHHQRYIIQIKNHSGERIEAVVTVDGRDVINGQPGAYHHRGYVINAHDSIEIEGFRRSADEVATFRFTTPGDSYASRMGDALNIGVIGVATFSERRRRPRYTRPHRRAQINDEDGGGRHRDVESSAEAPSASGSSGLVSGARSKRRSAPRLSAPRSEIGTRYGEHRRSSSVETTFHRVSQRPFTVFSITYDSERGLRRRGVLPRYAPHHGHPNPFPQRYAPSPY